MTESKTFSVKLTGFPSRRVAEEFITFYGKHGEQMFYEWLQTLDLPTEGTMVDVYKQQIETDGCFEVFLG